MTKSNYLTIAIQAAISGGLEIMKVYESDFDVELKKDDSPLTLADRNAHLKICEILEGTGIPILSEEGKTIAFEERKDWDPYWIVDPLDGTKEFIKRNGEFTVNIALIEKGIPVTGVIYVPVKEVLYFSSLATGAYKENGVGKDYNFSLNHDNPNQVKLPVNKLERKFTVIGSRSHMSEETKEFIAELENEHGDIEIVSMGSSLKICLVAEGIADIYPRFAPTMEWDIAAGHAIALGAGKDIYDQKTGSRIQYNKMELLNNWFIVK